MNLPSKAPTSNNDVVFVIEATSHLSGSIEKLKSRYIIPAIEHFCGYPLEERVCTNGASSENTLFALVYYHTAAVSTRPASISVGPTSNAHKLLKWIDALKFVGGGSEGMSYLTEGIGSALQLFDDFDVLHEDLNTAVPNNNINNNNNININKRKLSEMSPTSDLPNNNDRYINRYSMIVDNSSITEVRGNNDHNQLNKHSNNSDADVNDDKIDSNLDNNSCKQQDRNIECENPSKLPLRDINNTNSTSKQDSKTSIKKHCILICNSQPYQVSCVESPLFQGLNLNKMVSLMREKLIALSIVCPRQLPFLEKLFVEAGGNLQMTSIKKCFKDEKHTVLLNGFSLEEKLKIVNDDGFVSEKADRQPLINTSNSIPQNNLGIDTLSESLNSNVNRNINSASTNQNQLSSTITVIDTSTGKVKLSDSNESANINIPSTITVVNQSEVPKSVSSYETGKSSVLSPLLNNQQVQNQSNMSSLYPQSNSNSLVNNNGQQTSSNTSSIQSVNQHLQKNQHVQSVSSIVTNQIESPQMIITTQVESPQMTMSPSVSTPQMNLQQVNKNYSSPLTSQQHHSHHHQQLIKQPQVQLNPNQQQLQSQMQNQGNVNHSTQSHVLPQPQLVKHSQQQALSPQNQQLIINSQQHSSPSSVVQKTQNFTPTSGQYQAPIYSSVNFSQNANSTINLMSTNQGLVQSMQLPTTNQSQAAPQAKNPLLNASLGPISSNQSINQQQTSQPPQQQPQQQQQQQQQTKINFVPSGVMSSQQVVVPPGQVLTSNITTGVLGQTIVQSSAGNNIILNNQQQQVPHHHQVKHNINQSRNQPVLLSDGSIQPMNQQQIGGLLNQPQVASVGGHGSQPSQPVVSQVIQHQTTTLSNQASRNQAGVPPQNRQQNLHNIRKLENDLQQAKMREALYQQQECQVPQHVAVSVSQAPMHPQHHQQVILTNNVQRSPSSMSASQQQLHQRQINQQRLALQHQQQQQQQRQMMSNQTQMTSSHSNTQALRNILQQPSQPASNSSISTVRHIRPMMTTNQQVQHLQHQQVSIQQGLQQSQQQQQQQQQQVQGTQPWNMMN